MDEDFNHLQSTYSEADGYYQFTLSPGSYTLAVSADGFGGVYYVNGYDDPGATVVTVTPGASVTGLDFSLSPEATISGYVFESDGVTPISEVPVRAWPSAGGRHAGLRLTQKVHTPSMDYQAGITWRLPRWMDMPVNTT